MLSDGAVAVWTARVAVVVSAVAGAVVLNSATGSFSPRVATTATVAGWSVWAVAAVASAVPSTVSLTTLRMIAPLQAGLGWWWLIGLGVGPATVTFAALAGGFAGAASSAALGAAYVHASAYGDERRFLLRPPVAMLLPAALTGVVWAAALGLAVVAAACWPWWAAIVAGLVAIGLTALAGPRLHVLARRWLVLVPAGLVVHDQVVLSETSMIEGRQIRRASLATEGTEALDLSGPASGHLVEVQLIEPALMLLRAGRASEPRALHVQSFMVAPSRPGAALAVLNGSRQR